MDMRKHPVFTLRALTVACCLYAGGAHASAMLGAYVDYDGWNTTTIDQLNAATTKPLSVVNLFSGFDQNWATSLAIQATNIVSRHAAPMITWMPSQSARPDANLLGEISNGQWDAYIDTWIAGLKNWQATYPADKRPTVLLRFAHEFNGNWYAWGNEPDGLKAAWRYLHTRFAQAGVTGVEWVWCANNVNVDSYNDVTRYYPGDDVVDWTALDGYNWGSNYSFTQWKGFAETFSTPYTTLVTNYPTKPILLAEVASAEPADVPNPLYGQNGNDSDAGQSKEAWVQDMYTRIMTEYPAIRAVAWFNTNKELGWALNGAGNTGLVAYNSVTANSYYSGTFAPLTTAPTAPTTTTTNTKGGKSGGGGKKTSTSTMTTLSVTDDTQDTSLQRALAVSHMPAVVGEKLLESEAEGFRSLSPSALKALREERVR
jgi:beta-mannanase